MAATCNAYLPSELDAQRFWNEGPLTEKGSVDVPDGFPKKIHSSLAWTPAEIAEKQDECKLVLSGEDIAAVDAAVAAFEGKYDDLSAISVETFELPAALSKRLKSVSDQLYNGRGFQVVNGLDPAKYTPRQHLIVYAGISAHICPQRGFVDQNYESVLTHVVNVQGKNNGAKRVAPAFSNIPLSFHTDNCEIFALYYVDVAPKGGETTLASSWQVYNELAANRPEILHTLSEPWWMDTFKPTELFPPRHWRLLQVTNDGRVLIRFSRYGITGWQHERSAELPTPTQAQLEAIDAVQFTAMKNAITLPIVRGDMVFVNDMAMMHARHGFDEQGVAMKRHLIKMFFRDPEQNWSVPPSMESDMNKIYGPNREDGTKQEVWHIYHEAGLEGDSRDNG